MRRLEPTESQIQQAYFEWVRLNENKDWRFSQIFAVPNGSNTTENNRARLIAEGLKSGVSDIIGLVPAGIFHGFAAEFKTKTGKLRDEQKDFLKKAAMQGYAAFVWRSVERAIADTELYMQQKVNRCYVCGGNNGRRKTERKGDKVPSVCAT